MCVYARLKGNRVTQREPQSCTDSPSRDTEEDEIRDLNLTGKGGSKRNSGEEDELQYSKSNWFLYFARNHSVCTPGFRLVK